MLSQISKNGLKNEGFHPAVLGADALKTAG
jgi:hypothetical protein